MKKLIGAAALALLLIGVGGIAYAAGQDGSNEPAPSSSRMATTLTSLPPVGASEASFVALTPCRLVDTRVAGGKLTDGAIRSYEVRGSALSGQGGKADCGVPAGAAAVSLSITAVSTTGTGYLVVYPGDAPRPGSRSLSFVKGVNQTGSATTGLAATGPDFRLYTSRATHVLVDVTGYYAAPMAAFVALDGSLQYATSRVSASSHLSTGNYVVTFDRDVSRCAFQVTPYSYNWVVAVGPQFGNANQAHVYIHDQGDTLTAHDTSFFIQAVC